MTNDNNKKIADKLAVVVANYSKNSTTGEAVNEWTYAMIKAVEDAKIDPEEDYDKIMNLAMDIAKEELSELADEAISLGVFFSADFGEALLIPMSQHTEWKSSSYQC